MTCVSDEERRRSRRTVAGGLTVVFGGLLFLALLPFPSLSGRDAAVLGTADVAGAVGVLLLAPRLIRTSFSGTEVADLARRQSRAIVLGLPLALVASAVGPYLASRIGLAALSVPAAVMLGLLAGLALAMPATLDGLAMRAALQKRATKGDKAAAAELAILLESQRRRPRSS